jgi:hypothetical protein
MLSRINFTSEISVNETVVISFFDRIDSFCTYPEPMIVANNLLVASNSGSRFAQFKGRKTEWKIETSDGKQSYHFRLHILRE